MIDIKWIRTNPDLVKANIKKREMNLDSLVDEILAIDVQRRELTGKVEGMKAEQNACTKKIPAMKKAGEDTTALMAEMKALSEKVKEAGAQLAQLEEKQQVALNSLTGGSRAAGSKAADEILADIREAIAKGSFRTFLQPKAEAATGRVCGAEALIRYQDEKYGVVPPGRFLPGIERAGLIRHIDLFVLEDVCRLLKSWMGKGWTPFPISLNYSRATILEPGILEETNRIVERYGIAKELIEIEVTESISSIDSVSLQDIVTRFVEAGYHMALDDFGAEYSNIYVLYSLDIHSLKLERRIVGDVYHDSRARMVVESLIGICKRLGIACVAEGVETAEQFEALREMGCALIQGYYLNKPLSEKDFETQYIFPQQ